MIWFDYIILFLLIISAVHGYRKGLIHQLASLGGWVLGIYFAVKLSKWLVPSIYPVFINQLQLAKILTFIFILIFVIITLNILGKILEKFFEDIELDWMMKIGGILFSVLKTSLLLSVFMILLHLSIVKLNWPSEEIRERSALYQPIESIVPSIFTYLKDSNKSSI